MKIALAQTRPRSGDVTTNTRIIVDQVRAAAGRGCDVVVLPEMSDTGYHMPSIVETASPWERGPYPEVATTAAQMRLTVVVGLSERVGEDIYNTVAVIRPDGDLLAKYRKTHLVTAERICEQNYLRAGNALTLCDIGEFRAGLMTCYDIRFPELARRLTLSAAEILIVPAAWPQTRIKHWDILTTCRAIENQVYVAAVNRVGEDEGLEFGGSSRLLDPFGTPVAAASETDETMLIADVSRERLLEVRNRMHVLADRRPELY